MENPLRQGLATHFTPEQLRLLANARIGIAGAGGLGSNAAMLLARSGIEKFTLVDHDVLEASNLNRQHYWPKQIGQPKVAALSEHLLALNPALELDLRQTRLDSDNLPEIIKSCPIWIEALDNAANKKRFVETALLSGCKVAAASGLAGFGGKPMAKRKFGKLCVVGDFETDIAQAPPLAPRVAQAAALLADAVLEFVLGSA